MTPFPRWFNVLALLAVIFGALNSTSVLSIVSPDVGVGIAGFAAIASALSTHITQNGIPVGWGWFGAASSAFAALNLATVTDAAGKIVPLVSVLPARVASVVLVVGAIIAAIAKAEHPVTGVLPGTSKLSGS